MAIYRASDSLSRCDPHLYSNIYDVRKRPDIKHESTTATQPIHKDTIEISRDKLKEEALNRLRHTSKYVIAQNGFMRIGKYLFLAIAFPPYFVLYGLPKWVLVEGIPALFSVNSWIWRKVLHKTNKQVEAGKQKIIQMMHFMQRLTQALIQPIIHLALEIRQSIRRMREQVLQFVKEKMGKAKAILTLPGRKLIEKNKQMRRRLSQIKEKLSQQVEQVSIRMQEGIQWIKERPQVFLGWGQAQFQNLNQQVLSWRFQWKARLETSQQFAQQGTDWVAKKFRDGKNWLKQECAPLIDFYQQQLQPRWQKLTKSCKGKWQQTRDFFHQKHQRALAFLQAKQEKLKHLSSSHLLKSLISHPWMAKLPSHFQYWLKMCLSHPITRAVCDGIVKTYAFSARMLLQTAILGLQMLSQGAAWSLKSCNLLRRFVKIAGQNIAQALNMGHRACRKGALYALYYYLLLTVMILILCVWGLRYLRHCMRSLTLKFSLKDQLAGFKN